MDVKIEESWKERLAPEFEKSYFNELINFVKQEYSQGAVYPPGPAPIIIKSYFIAIISPFEYSFLSSNQQSPSISFRLQQAFQIPFSPTAVVT